MNVSKKEKNCITQPKKLNTKIYHYYTKCFLSSANSGS